MTTQASRALEAATVRRMSKHARWINLISVLPKCCRCKRPATHVLQSGAYKSRCHYCDDCAAQAPPAFKRDPLPWAAHVYAYQIERNEEQ